MIVPPNPEPKSNPTDAPLDAPPAYDGTGAPSGSRPPIVEKGSARAARAPTSPASPSSSTVHRGQSRAVQKNTWTSLSDNVGDVLVEVGLGSAQRRVAKEVRKTVSGLIHDLVRDQTVDSNISCVGILESCSEVCAAHSVNMPGILQQPYIEGHTPLYWAIVKRPVDESEPQASFELPPLICTLLAYSAPLQDSTIKDARLACLHNCDQWLFQSLRLCPDFQALSHKSQLLLGVQVPPDTITVGASARHDAPFTVDFEFAQFQKRMRVSQDVHLDFISHARMWRISFFVAANTWGLNDGQWAARLSLCENSPSTAVTATYILNELTPQESSDSDESVVTLKLDGKLGLNQDLHVALPDAVQYPRSPFLTADGTLRGKLTVEITNK